METTAPNAPTPGPSAVTAAPGAASADPGPASASPRTAKGIELHCASSTGEGAAGAAVAIPAASLDAVPF